MRLPGPSGYKCQKMGVGTLRQFTFGQFTFGQHTFGQPYIWSITTFGHFTFRSFYISSIDTIRQL